MWIMTEDSRKIPFEQVSLSKEAFIRDWRSLRDTPVEDFIADKEKHWTIYESFRRHERVARVISEPPVIVFREDPKDINNRFAENKRLEEFTDLDLTARSGLPYEKIIARFDLDDPDNLYFLTPPIGVLYPPPETPTAIQVARVPKQGGYRRVTTRSGKWRKDRSGGLYVRQNTRNVSEITDKIRPRTSMHRYNFPLTPA